MVIVEEAFVDVGRLPQATAYAIADAGHSPQLEAPQAFQAALLAFLRGG